tara:strand:- start:482 stop:943 length:462 start_codon:yes stop_codon:yes gene_type:complete
MGMLTKGLGFLGSNLSGVLGTKWFMAVALTIFIGMNITIYTFQKQKENLREEKTELSAQLSKEQAEHLSEIERITVLHNQIIKDSISQEDIARLQAQLESEKIKAKIELDENKKLNNRLKELENLKEDDYFKQCPIPEDVKSILNKGKSKPVK